MTEADPDPKRRRSSGIFFLYMYTYIYICACALINALLRSSLLRLSKRTVSEMSPIRSLLKPYVRVLQCNNGHLMCAGCFTHLLADARLRDETATCPNCRVEISKTAATRNLAVENAVSELPSECQYCGKEFPRNSLERHEEQMCEER